MNHLPSQKNVVDILILINTALTNLRLYPPSSAIIVQNIDRLHDALQEIFTVRESIVFAEAEKTLLFCEEALPEKDQKRPQVSAFLDVLLNFGIKSITFEKGVDKRELTAFFDLMKSKPETVKQDGGLKNQIAKKQLSHILLNKKIFVAHDEDQQVLSSLNIKDEQIIQFLAATHPDGPDMDADKLREMAKDADWVSGIFRSGMKQIMDGKGAVEFSGLSEGLMQLLRILDRVTEKTDQDRVARPIGKTIAGLDPEMLGNILIQQIEGLFGGKLIQHILAEIGDEAYEQVAAEIKLRADRLADGGADPESSALKAMTETYTFMVTSERGKNIRSHGAEKQAADRMEKETRKRLLDERTRKILDADDTGLLDVSLMTSVPDLVEKLSSEDAQETTESVVEKLARSLSHVNPEIRANASVALADIIERLPEERQRALTAEYAKNLTAWIRLEQTVSEAYKTICRQLKSLAANYILSRRLQEALPVVTVFNEIAGGTLEKNDAVRGVAQEFITDTACGDLLGVLFDEFMTNKEGKQGEAGRLLVSLGQAPLSRLLDMLMESHGKNERIRILQLIVEAQKNAAPLIIERMNEEGPWFYLRNIAYLWGRVGREADAPALRPLLLNENSKVRDEALKSLQRIGGPESGALLLSALSEADDAFKLSIVDTLGTMKVAAAVEPLHQLLKDRPFIVTSGRYDLEEKICSALGQIGSPESLPVLSRISQPGFVSVRSYPEKVKIAAARALASIKRKQSKG